MTENRSETIAGLVIDRKRKGRNVYSARAKRALVEACMRPGVSVAKMALTHGVNANLLRKWIRTHVGENPGAPQSGTGALTAMTLLPVTSANERVKVRGPVEQQESVSTESCIEIILSRATLLLRGRVDMRQLREVIDCVLARS